VTPAPDPGTVTPSPADPTPPAPVDTSVSSPVKHPPTSDPSTTIDGGTRVVAPPAQAPPVEQPATTVTASVSDVNAPGATFALNRSARVTRIAPPSLQSSPVPGIPSEGAPVAPSPSGPLSPHNDGPFLAFEAGASSSASSHGSNNILPFAAVLVMLGVICAALLRRAQRYVSVPPRLNFAFAFERPG
jgi:hypothetical protein